MASVALFEPKNDNPIGRVFEVCARRNVRKPRFICQREGGWFIWTVRFD